MTTEQKPTWTHLDVGDRATEASTRVAGLSLIARQLRLAAYNGLDGAVVQTAAETQSLLQKAVDRNPPPKTFPVHFIGQDETLPNGRHYIRFAPTAVYRPSDVVEAAKQGSNPKPLMEIESKRDVHMASARLAKLNVKSVNEDGVLAHYIFRLLSRPIARALAPTPVTPNVVTTLALLVGITAAFMAALGTSQGFLVAGALYLLSGVIDCIDGDLARLRLERSKVGEWLDTIADDISTYGLLAGISYGVLHNTDTLLFTSTTWSTIGFAAAGLGLLLSVKIYMDLHAWGMQIDTAQYPWFWGTPSKGDTSGGSLWSKLIYRIAFLFRRDIHVTLVAVLLALNYPILALSIVTGGVAITLTLFLINMAVNAKRKRAGLDARDGAWSIGYIGAKDLFTMLNLAGGIMGIYYALQGNIRWAGYAIFLGYLLGDAMDGVVARLTKTSNQFGSELDAAADHIAQAIAPAIITYAAFTLGDYEILGVVCMGVIIATASIRQARFNAASFNFPLAYCGLPRTVSGILIISLPNSALFENYLTFPIGAGIIFFAAFMNLGPVPYMTHKGTRKMQPVVKLFVFSFLFAPLALVFISPRYVYDFLFIFMVGYALGGWIPLYKDERKAYWREFKRWHQELLRK